MHLYNFTLTNSQLHNTLFINMIFSISVLISKSLFQDLPENLVDTKRTKLMSTIPYLNWVFQYFKTYSALERISCQILIFKPFQWVARMTVCCHNPVNDIQILGRKGTLNITALITCTRYCMPYVLQVAI